MKSILVRMINYLLSAREAEVRDDFPSSLRPNIDSSFAMGKYRNLQIQQKAFLQIEPHVSFREFCNILVHDNANLFIGRNVFFNNYCSINCFGKIEIGQNTLFGESVKLYDHNHVYSSNETLKIERENFKIGYIHIGKDCWIGSNVTILNNVEIGDNVIIGANCLIHKSIPANSIVRYKQEIDAQSRISEI